MTSQTPADRPEEADQAEDLVPAEEPEESVREEQPEAAKEPVRDEESEAPADSVPDAAPEPAPWSRRLAALTRLARPRATLGQALAGILCLLVGFAVIAQVGSSTGETRFATARQDELVGVLDDQNTRLDRLHHDVDDLSRTKTNLEKDGNGDTALTEARRRADTYGILAGTKPATGPGVTLTITDPQHRVTADQLLNTLQELRDAGAEVVQIGPTRVVVNSYFLDSPGGGITLDGHQLTVPYRFLAIGDPRTLATALTIPGGVRDSLTHVGATLTTTRQTTLTISATR